MRFNALAVSDDDFNHRAFVIRHLFICHWNKVPYAIFNFLIPLAAPLRKKLISFE